MLVLGKHVTQAPNDKEQTVATETALLPHHPCDICFEGVAESGLCHTGENRIELGKVCDMVYLEGDFIFDDGVLKKPTAPTTGNLAAAGYPHYWGSVDYVFSFTGKHSVCASNWPVQPR